MTDQTPPPTRDFEVSAPARPWRALSLRPSWWWLPPLAGLALIGTVLVGMATSHVIDDRFEISPGNVLPSQSRAVAIASQLIFREIDQNSWSANDPFFQPGWWLDNMPNFQQGIVAACARFANAMATASDDGQGPSPSLERAAGLLKYPGTVWKFDPSTSWSPTASSEKQYRNAARNLAEYNQELAGGTDRFNRDAATLHALIAALGADLAAISAEIDQHLAEDRSALFDGTADDVFFLTKGKVYAYGLILREIGWDHAQLLADRELGAAWRQMTESLRVAATLQPLMVLNGAPDGTFLPSHLTAQGFYLLRARAQLTEIGDALAH